MQVNQSGSVLAGKKSKGSLPLPLLASACWMGLTLLACSAALWRGVEAPIVLAGGALSLAPALIDIISGRRDNGTDGVEIWVVFAWLGLAFVAVWASGSVLSPLSILLAMGPLYAFSVGRFRLGVEASVFAAMGFLGIGALDELGYGMPSQGGLGLLPALGAMIGVLQIGVFIAASAANIRVSEADRRLLKTWESTLWGVPVLVLRLDQNGHIINWLGSQKILGTAERHDLTKYGVVDVFTNSNVIRGVDGKPVLLRPVWNETLALEARLLRAPGGYRMVVSPITEALEQASNLRKLAEERDLDLSGQAKWVASLGHEMRNMLNPISGYTDLIISERSGSIGDTNKEFARSIKQGAEHLAMLIDDLMTATKSRTGNLKLSPEMLDLREEIESAIRLINWQAESHQVNVLLADGVDTDVFADRKALRQILINLMSNAIKYSQSGGRVTVAVKRDQGMICVEVRDEGEGMSEKDLARIGEAFFQGENAKGRVGTGLGLTIVMLLAKAMGGRFGIASEVDVGTVAAVWLLPEAADQTETVSDETKAAEAS